MSQAFPPGPLSGAAAIDEGTLALAPTPTPGPSGLGEDAGPARSATDHAQMSQPFEWRALGFKSPPRLVLADGRRLFRVWGGTSLERGDPHGRGVFFSFVRPASRGHAERLFAIVEFGNPCRVVSEFDVPPGTPMFVGAVDPGDDVMPSLAEAGEQVFIRNPWAQRLVQVGLPARLEDDLGGAWVYSGPKTREPAKDVKTGWN